MTPEEKADALEAECVSEIEKFEAQGMAQLEEIIRAPLSTEKQEELAQAVMEDANKVSLIPEGVEDLDSETCLSTLLQSLREAKKIFKEKHASALAQAMIDERKGNTGFFDGLLEGLGGLKKTLKEKQAREDAARGRPLTPEEMSDDITKAFANATKIFAAGNKSFREAMSSNPTSAQADSARDEARLENELLKRDRIRKQRDKLNEPRPKTLTVEEEEDKLRKEFKAEISGIESGPGSPDMKRRAERDAEDRYAAARTKLWEKHRAG